MNQFSTLSIRAFFARRLGWIALKLHTVPGLRRNDAMKEFPTFYETINVRCSMISFLIRLDARDQRRRSDATRWLDKVRFLLPWREEIKRRGIRMVQSFSISPSPAAG